MKNNQTIHQRAVIAIQAAIAAYLLNTTWGYLTDPTLLEDEPAPLEDEPACKNSMLWNAAALTGMLTWTCVTGALAAAYYYQDQIRTIMAGLATLSSLQKGVAAQTQNTPPKKPDAAQTQNTPPKKPESEKYAPIKEKIDAIEQANRLSEYPKMIETFKAETSPEHQKAIALLHARLFALHRNLKDEPKQEEHAQAFMAYPLAKEELAKSYKTINHYLSSQPEVEEQKEQPETGQKTTVAQAMRNMANNPKMLLSMLDNPAVLTLIPAEQRAQIQQARKHPKFATLLQEQIQNPELMQQAMAAAENMGGLPN